LDEDITSLIYIEHCKEVEILNDLMCFPSYTVLNGYLLIARFEEDGTILFRTSKVNKANLDIYNAFDTEVEGNVMKGMHTCNFDLFKGELKNKNYIIPGLSDSLEAIEKVASCETIRYLTNKHYNRLLAFDMINFESADGELEMRLLKSGYTQLIEAARDLLSAINEHMKNEMLALLYKEMSLWFIIFITSYRFRSRKKEPYSSDMIQLTFDNLEKVLF